MDYVNRVLWGFWKITISEDGSHALITPQRTAELHVNTVRLLEVTPCSNCLTIDQIIIMPDRLIQADLVLRHPFPGAVKFTAFDVRGIFISEADYQFPVSGGKIPTDIHPSSIRPISPKPAHLLWATYPEEKPLVEI